MKLLDRLGIDRLDAVMFAIALLASSSAIAWASQPLREAPGKHPNYHDVPLEKMATTNWTHACTTGPVVYRRQQSDGDWHITLDNGRAKVVLEIIPAIPLEAPKKGQTIEACGITRIDRHHNFAELHPLLKWSVKK